MAFHFSKSKYCRLWQCPKMVWLDKFRSEEAVEDPDRVARMQTGNRVGELAKGLFGDYVDMTVETATGLDLSAMMEKTKEAMDAGAEVICEAAFSYDGLYCAVDILRKEKDGYAIYEVKSSTVAKPVYSVDIAYQKFVLEHCGVRVTGTYLVCMNNTYYRDETLDIQQLFKVINVSRSVAKETPNVENRLAEAKKLLADDTEPNYDLGSHCGKPYVCAYWQYCSRNLPKPSVADLAVSLGSAMKLYDQGAVTLEDTVKLNLPLKASQERMVRHNLADLPDEIHKAGIQDFLDSLTYPLYFLDFESMQQAIPEYPNEKSYDQIVFQYSLHYMQTPGGELKHTEFLAESGPDPRRAVAESLCRDIPTEGSILAYHDGFEGQRLEELARVFPDLADQLLRMAGNLVDLEDPFKKGYYYTKAMGCSSSIKKVLPALFPNDPELDYHSLEDVHNGSEAMQIFPKLKDMPPEEAARIRKNLLAYCKLDTLAMVKILEKLQEVVK